MVSFQSGRTMATVVHLALAFFFHLSLTFLQPIGTVAGLNHYRSPEPQALQLVDFTGTPSLNEQALAAVFDHPNCRDRPVVVVSIAGDYRKGKSFMLNMFLKYLTDVSRQETGGNTKDWLADDEKPFKGFSYRGGIKRDTTGILIWSEPFVRTLPSGEEVAVVVLDTQGTFDSQSTVAESTQIFALSTMISSIQIYNQFSNIQENDLQQLSLFVEYGVKALAARKEPTGGSKSAMTAPFQKLVLLVRDWRFQTDFPCNEAGSRSYLEAFLRVTSNQASEVQVVRRQLTKCFSELDCVLLPQPGSVVESGQPLESMAALNEDFRRELRRFVSSLFSPERLMVKTSSGRRLTGHQLTDYIKTYCKVIFSGELPSPTSMWRATAEVDHRLAMGEALLNFKVKMDNLTSTEQPIDSDELSGQILIFKRESKNIYANAPKMEDDQVKAKFTNELVEKLDALSLSYLKQNRVRRDMFVLEFARGEAEARAAQEEEGRKAAVLAATKEREEARKHLEMVYKEQNDAMERARKESNEMLEKVRAAGEAARLEAEARATKADEDRKAAEERARLEREEAREREERFRQEQNEVMEKMREELQKEKEKKAWLEFISAIAPIITAVKGLPIGTKE